MRYLSAFYTDIGTQKKSNQDSLLIQEANTATGTTLLAVLCDGLGGLQKGEIASAEMIKAFSAWFQYQYPILLNQRFTADGLRESWSQLVSETHRKLTTYGKMHGLSLGTTVEAVLFYEKRYYVFHIGDCRVYKKEGILQQITKDQTYIQQEMDYGRMTLEEAIKDPKRNMLLQCVGAGNYLAPDFIQGELAPEQGFLICSDGFRHVISTGEIAEGMRLPSSHHEDFMRKRLEGLTELCKQRGEKDNITSIWIQVCR